MDDLESSALPESSGLSSSGEAVKEKSEKQKEAYKKAQAQLQKSQKDEKKAKGDNEDLFTILQRFIQNPYYEGLIPTVTELLQIATPSRCIIGLTALVYPESALHMLTKIGKKEQIDTLLSIHHYPEKTSFNEHTLHPSIRSWMSSWVQFSGNYLVAADASHILEDKLLHLITEHKTSIVIQRALGQFLYFFFVSRNLEVSLRTTDSYAEFILREYRKLLEKAVSEADPDLLGIPNPESANLFGLD